MGIPAGRGGGRWREGSSLRYQRPPPNAATVAFPLRLPGPKLPDGSTLMRAIAEVGSTLHLATAHPRKIMFGGGNK